jgi:hypothetical protein
VPQTARQKPLQRYNHVIVTAQILEIRFGNSWQPVTRSPARLLRPISCQFSHLLLLLLLLSDEALQAAGPALKKLTPQQLRQVRARALGDLHFELCETVSLLCLLSWTCLFLGPSITDLQMMQMIICSPLCACAQVLRYHVLLGEYTLPADMKPGQAYATALKGQFIKLRYTP